MNENGSFPDGQVWGWETAKRSLCKGNDVVPMGLNVPWLLSCGMDRCWESSEEFLSRGQSQNPCRPLVSGPRGPVSLRFETVDAERTRLPFFWIANREDVAQAASVHFSLDVESTCLISNWIHTQREAEQRWRVRRAQWILCEPREEGGCVPSPPLSFSVAGASNTLFLP